MVEPNQKQLEQIKACELDMLCAFVQVCEKLSLRYYLLFGTLLGAVRHQGFIPWDDDIDVGMPRADYEIFVKEAQALLPQYYFVQNMDTDPGYYMNFTKIRDNRTTFVEYNVRKFSMNHGVFIDIFPLDYYPDGRMQRVVMDFKQEIYKNRLRSMVEVPQGAQHSPFVEFVLNMFANAVKLVTPNVRRLFEKRERMQRNLLVSSRWVNYSGSWKHNNLPVEWYAEGVKLQFEDMQVNCPLQYDKYLSQVYGNYMQLPPPDKQIGHHYAQIIDLDTPYTEYMDQLRKEM